MTSPTAPPPIKPGILTLRWGCPQQDNANGASAPNAAWDAWKPTTCRSCLICTGKSLPPEPRSAHGHELRGSGRYATTTCIHLSVCRKYSAFGAPSIRNDKAELTTAAIASDPQAGA